MKLARQIVFWCHLAVGVVVAAVVVIMSATGVLLTYQRQITSWADTRTLDGGAPNAAAARVPIDSLIRTAQRATTATATAVTLRAAANAPVEIALGRDRRVFINAYTGTILGEGSANTRAFFRRVTAWHRTLGATGERRALGRMITGASNLGFLFLVASGFFLWWPRTWSRNALRAVIAFRRRLSPKARDFNWHHVIGFWSAVPLFIVVASGVVMSYGWANALVYRFAGEHPPTRSAAPAESRGGPNAEASTPTLDGLNALVAVATERVPAWRTITFQVPRGDARSMAFSIDAGTGGQPQARAQLTLSRATGDETKWEPFTSQSAGRRARSMLRFAHTGEVLGVAGQTIAGLVSLASIVLAWTGLALALRRLAAWRGRRTRHALTDEPADEIAWAKDRKRSAVAKAS